MRLCSAKLVHGRELTEIMCSLGISHSKSSSIGCRAVVVVPARRQNQTSGVWDVVAHDVVLARS